MHLDTPSLFKSKHTLKFIRRNRKSNVKRSAGKYKAFGITD